jgi:hypothetical protein
MRLTYYCKNKDCDPECCTITYAKKMIKKQGGFAYTEHIDRDGGCFEVTEVKLEGNNSKFKYNHHL